MTTDEMNTIERMSTSDRRLMLLLDRWTTELHRDLRSRHKREVHAGGEIREQWLENYRMYTEMQDLRIDLLAKYGLKR